MIHSLKVKGSNNISVLFTTAWLAQLGERGFKPLLDQHGFIRRLAASRLRKAARWQLTQGLKPFAKLFLLFWNSLTKKDNYQSNDQ